jgi:hypothetical protein
MLAKGWLRDAVIQHGLLQYSPCQVSITMFYAIAGLDLAVVGSFLGQTHGILFNSFLAAPDRGPVSPGTLVPILRGPETGNTEICPAGRQSGVMVELVYRFVGVAGCTDHT